LTLENSVKNISDHCSAHVTVYDIRVIRLVC